MTDTSPNYPFDTEVPPLTDERISQLHIECLHYAGKPQAVPGDFWEHHGTDIVQALTELMNYRAQRERARQAEISRIMSRSRMAGTP